MDEFSDMLQTLKQSGLSAEERDAIRTRLRLFMDAHPAQAPLFIRTRASVLAFFSSRHIRIERAVRSVALASLAVVFVGAGTSYAAENALPGQPLYAIKIHVNEPVRAALATTPSAQAQWNTEVATRRLEEAEALAATGKLTPVTASDLQSEITQATQHFDASVASVQTAEGSGAALSVRSDMQATLDAHANVLQAIAATVPSVRSTLVPIIDDVQAQAGAFAVADTEQTAQSTDTGPGRSASVHTAATMRPTTVRLNGSATLVSSTSTLSDDSSSSASSTTAASTSAATSSAAADQNKEMETRRIQIEESARAWLKNAAGISLPPPPVSDIDDAYSATNGDATTSTE